MERAREAAGPTSLMAVPKILPRAAAGGASRDSAYFCLNNSPESASYGLAELRSRLACLTPDAERFGPTPAMLRGVTMRRRFAMMMLLPLMMIVMKHTSRCRQRFAYDNDCGGGGGRASLPRDAAEVRGGRFAETRAGQPLRRSKGYVSYSSLIAAATCHG